MISLLKKEIQSFLGSLIGYIFKICFFGFPEDNWINDLDFSGK